MAGLVVCGWVAGLGGYYYLLLMPAGVQLAWQASRVDIEDPKNCLAMFKSNRNFGLIVTLAIVFG